MAQSRLRISKTKPKKTIKTKATQRAVKKEKMSEELRYAIMLALRPSIEKDQRIYPQAQFTYTISPWVVNDGGMFRKICIIWDKSRPFIRPQFKKLEWDGKEESFFFAHEYRRNRTR